MSGRRRAQLGGGRSELSAAEGGTTSGRRPMGIRLSREEAWDVLAAAHTGILTTLRADGTPIALPVWFVVLDERIYVGTPEHTKKVARVKRNPRASFLVESGLDPRDYRGTTFWEGTGCIDCNGTGFHGRAAISELLDLSDRIRGMILDRRPASEIKKAAKEEGMNFLRESALKKVMEGTTTLREINKVTFVD